MYHIKECEIFKFNDVFFCDEAHQFIENMFFLGGSCHYWEIYSIVACVPPSNLFKHDIDSDIVGSLKLREAILFNLIPIISSKNFSQELLRSLRHHKNDY